MSSKPEIHQVYGTHCTYGTSAIEPRQGDAAKGILGYSARASSVEQHKLRDYYRKVNRFLYYYVPTDAPDDVPIKWTPQTAPRRLVFCPSVSGLQLLGLVSYRQRDRANRPGSYFGHFISSEGDNSHGWDILDCLELWEAKGWVREDSEDIDPAVQLKLLDDPEDLLIGREPLDFGEVLQKSLALPPSSSRRATRALPPGAQPGLGGNATGGNSALSPPPAPGKQNSTPGSQSAPASPLAPPPPPPPRRKVLASNALAGNGPTKGIVPPRWTSMAQEKRRAYFGSALAGYLDVFGNQRGSLLLVVEPEMAVLMCYFIARLLPRAIRDQISFSSYETNPDSLCTQIAAIQFHNPERTDLKPEQYNRDTVVNTYTGQTSASAGTATAYLNLVWQQKLLDKGWAEAEEIVEACEAAGANRLDELETCARAELQATATMNPPQSLAPRDRQPRLVQLYVDRRVSQQLLRCDEKSPLGREKLKAILKSPAHLQAVLQRTAMDERPAAQVEFLLKHTAGDKFNIYRPLLPHVLSRYILVACDLKPNELCRELENPNFPLEVKPHLLRGSLDVIPLEHFDRFLKIRDDFVGLEHKLKLVDRLAPEHPSSRIVPFLQDDRIPQACKHRSLEHFVKRIALADFATLLALADQLVPVALKNKAVDEYVESGKFGNGPGKFHPVKFLREPTIPRPCKQHALANKNFLASIPKDEHWWSFLTLNDVDIATKYQVVDNLAGNFDSAEVRPFLTNESIPAACRIRALNHAAFISQIGNGEILLLLRDGRVPLEGRRIIQDKLASKVPIAGLLDLLSIDVVELQKKYDAIERHIAELRIEDFVHLLQHPSIPERCKLRAAARRDFVKELREDQILPLAGHSSLPRECRDKILDALVENVPPGDFLQLLKLDIPHNYKLRAIEVHARKLPDEQIVPFLASRDVPLEYKENVVAELAARVPAQDAAAFLQLVDVAPRYKEAFLERHAANHPHDIVPLLCDEAVPNACKNWINGHALQLIPESDFVRLMKAEEIPNKTKGAALENYFRRCNVLPPKCKRLWIEELPINDPNAPMWPAGPMTALLAKLDCSGITDLLLLYPETYERHGKFSLFVSLFRAAEGDFDKQQKLVELAGEIDSKHYELVLGKLRPILDQRGDHYRMGPQLREKLGRMLSGIVTRLALEPHLFEQRLKEVDSPVLRESLSAEAEVRLRSWRRIHAIMGEAHDAGDREVTIFERLLQKDGGKSKQIERFDALREQLAPEINAAMPDEYYKNTTLQKKLDALRKLAKQLRVSDSFLQSQDYCFEHFLLKGRWPDGLLRMRERRKEKRRTLLIAVASGVGLVLLIMFLFAVPTIWSGIESLVFRYGEPLRKQERDSDDPGKKSDPPGDTDHDDAGTVPGGVDMKQPSAQQSSGDVATQQATADAANPGVAAVVNASGDNASENVAAEEAQPKKPVTAVSVAAFNALISSGKVNAQDLSITNVHGLSTISEQFKANGIPVTEVVPRSEQESSATAADPKMCKSMAVEARSDGTTEPLARFVLEPQLRTEIIRTGKEWKSCVLELSKANESHFVAVEDPVSTGLKLKNGKSEKVSQPVWARKYEVPRNIVLIDENERPYTFKPRTDVDPGTDDRVWTYPTPADLKLMSLEVVLSESKEGLTFRIRAESADSMNISEDDKSLLSTLTRDPTKSVSDPIEPKLLRLISERDRLFDQYRKTKGFMTKPEALAALQTLYDGLELAKNEDFRTELEKKLKELEQKRNGPMRDQLPMQLPSQLPQKTEQREDYREQADLIRNRTDNRLTQYRSDIASEHELLTGLAKRIFGNNVGVPDVVARSSSYSVSDSKYPEMSKEYEAAIKGLIDKLRKEVQRNASGDPELVKRFKTLHVQIDRIVESGPWEIHVPVTEIPTPPAVPTESPPGQ